MPGKCPTKHFPMLHTETITPETLELLKQIQALPEFAALRLVGGTSLALRLGHRLSIDLDLFGEWPEEADLHAALARLGDARKVAWAPGGKMQFFYVNGIKLDCVTCANSSWLDPHEDFQGIRLATIRDIAAMKVNAITNRGTRKDFVDLAFLLEQYSINEILEWYVKKYPETNPAQAMRSLCYFADAEQQPMPRMLKPFDWEAAKTKIQSEVRNSLHNN